MIRIELVRVGYRLVGRTVSDRWNLMTLGIGPIPAEWNQAAVKRLRRALGGEGFSLGVVRGEAVRWAATHTELDALGVTWAARLALAA